MSTRNFFRYWLPLIAYCALIFILSSQPLPEKVPVFFGVDKVMHAAAWTVLGILCFRAFQSRWSQAKPSAIVALSVVASVLFGISDEFHQSFVPSRTADIRDLVFDFLGSIVGSGICRLFYAKSAKIHPRVTLR